MRVQEIAKQWDDDAEVIDVVPAAVSKDELAVQAQSWAARAAALRITNTESCVNASQLLKSIKHLRSGVAKESRVAHTKVGVPSRYRPRASEIAAGAST